MSKLRVLLVAAAAPTAACGGAATISGSQVKSVTNSDVRVDAGANAGTDIASGAAVSDPGRGNPIKAPGGPVPVPQSPPPAPDRSGPAASGADPCTPGSRANTGVTPPTG